MYSVAAGNISIKKADLRPHEGSLINFSEKHVPVEGSIKLRVTLSTWSEVVDMDVNFFVVDALSTAYNVIMR